MYNDGTKAEIETPSYQTCVFPGHVIWSRRGREAAHPHKKEAHGADPEKKKAAHAKEKLPRHTEGREFVLSFPPAVHGTISAEATSPLPCRRAAATARRPLTVSPESPAAVRLMTRHGQRSLLAVQGHRGRGSGPGPWEEGGVMCLGVAAAVFELCSRRWDGEVLLQRPDMAIPSAIALAPKHAYERAS